jgi:hypothetical protein
MSVTTIIVINVALDLAILGALAFVMSRAARLTPALQPASGAPSAGARRRPPLPRAARHGRSRPRIGTAFE